MNLPPLDPSLYRDIVRRALDEDLCDTSGRKADVTTDATVAATAQAHGKFIVKADCVLAGLDVAFECFRLLEPDVQISAPKADGQRCGHGEVVAEISGLARTLLIGERTALNFLQRLSGIATMTSRFVDAARGRITVLDTRKTTPTLRVLEKYAVRAGGGKHYRFGLFDAVLIKDNHIALAGGVASAILRARASNPALPVEVEADTLDQVREALGAGADTILLDNMTTDDIRTAVSLSQGRVKLEISGGVTLGRMPELAATGADFVSAGALTHSAPAVDISFDIAPL
jgi:nicotinate-nucleotide pyrophosphorylase (carboxylating)